MNLSELFEEGFVREHNTRKPEPKPETPVPALVPAGRYQWEQNPNLRYLPVWARESHQTLAIVDVHAAEDDDLPQANPTGMLEDVKERQCTQCYGWGSELSVKPRFEGKMVMCEGCYKHITGPRVNPLAPKFVRKGTELVLVKGASVPVRKPDSHLGAVELGG